MTVLETVGSVFMLLGAAVAVLAGVGLLRFQSSFARIHAAGKASPVAFVVTAVGAAFFMDASGIALLLLSVGAMILTLPLGVHLLFRAANESAARTRGRQPDETT